MREWWCCCPHRWLRATSWGSSGSYYHPVHSSGPVWYRTQEDDIGREGFSDLGDADNLRPWASVVSYFLPFSIWECWYWLKEHSYILSKAAMIDIAWLVKNHDTNLWNQFSVFKLYDFIKRDNLSYRQFFLICMFLDCGRKPEYPETKPTQTRWKHAPHRNEWGWNSGP